jgi:hypothetical protein
MSVRLPIAFWNGFIQAAIAVAVLLMILYGFGLFP